MLRFSAEAEFERWLATCPLDPRSLTYAVSRTGDGLLNVQCNWKQQPVSALPVAAPALGSSCTAGGSRSTTGGSGVQSGEALRHPGGDDAAAAETGPADDSSAAAARSAEADRLRTMLDKMQSMVTANPATMQLASGYLAQLAGGAGGAGGARGA